jgi:hypothetical protein
VAVVELSTLPCTRHILDWYHLARRADKLNAVVHGRPTASQLRSSDHDWLSRLAGGLKWRLWDGRAQEAMRRLAVMLYVLGKSTVSRKPVARQIRKLTLELLSYLRNNSDSLPNYREGERTKLRVVINSVRSRARRGYALRAMQLDTEDAMRMIIEARIEGVTAWKCAESCTRQDDCFALLCLTGACRLWAHTDSRPSPMS